MKQLDYIRGFCEAEFPGSISAIESGEVNGAVPKDVADHMRRTGLPGALVPASSGGRGLSAVQALRIAVGLGSASASVAVAFAMHSFSVATVASLEEDESRGTLKRVATENLLMCSAFSEGGHGQSLRQPSVAAVRSKDGYWLLNGSKKPCTLAENCDIVTAGIGVKSNSSQALHQLAFAVFDRDRDGISSRPFWGNDVIQGAGSDELVFRNVKVSDRDIYLIDSQTAKSDRLDILGTAWFTLVLIGGYAGVALATIEQLYRLGRGKTESRAAALAAAAGDIESVLLASETISQSIDTRIGYDTLYSILQTRYTLERTLTRHRQELERLAGGSEFIRPSTLTTRTRSTQALQFHPPFWRDQFSEINRFREEGKTFGFL
ncbi:acyl-CoA dehydrogenase family protein [Corynebacterium bovis]|uniref:acyl-CoA dehydrogenase family protein n=1 Tax=Corynebacterium bovis TaxID=36808 RepID=UPI00313949F1